jgi:type IV pilus assembly protein PilY1
MRTSRIGQWSCAASAGVALLGAAARADAQQVDTNPPLPNVLLMLDTSGSMERMSDGSLPETNTANTCNCVDTNGVISCNWAQTPAPAENRWNTVQTALTGTLTNGFNCVAMPRNAGSTFAQEYQIGGRDPYDTGYYLPFHRMVAQDLTTGSPVACVIAPGTLPGAPPTAGVGPQVAGSGAGGSAAAFPSNAIVARQYGKLPPSATSCTFAQGNNGAIGAASPLIRFGLMTFDVDPDPGLGVSTDMPNTTASVLNPAFTGMWTYPFAIPPTGGTGWGTSMFTTPTGFPPGCLTASAMAVGARNPSAPPWEGRMMYFPATNDLSAQQSNNSQIEQVILATRPYGGTPVAGMFAAAQYYFWKDPNGPMADDYATHGCRPEFAILLTDGAPNLDLQPSCSQQGITPDGGTTLGSCPFALPQETARILYNTGITNGTKQFVTTYVLGFAVSQFQDNGTTAHCTDFATNGSLASSCDCSDPALPTKQPYGPCCELQCIARAGGSTQAYFADSANDLSAALNAILNAIAKNSTTRTTPAFSPVVSSVVVDPAHPATNAEIFLSSFNTSPPPPKSNAFPVIAPVPWTGNIQRQRYDCTANMSGTGYTVPTPTPNPTLGDDFAANLNSHIWTYPRTFYAFLPAADVSGNVDSTSTIRPYVSPSVGDGLGQHLARTYSGPSSAVSAGIPASAFGSSIGACNYTSKTTGGVIAMDNISCKSMLFNYLFGDESFSAQGMWPGFVFDSRYNYALGDIYHATPAVVGPPGSLLQDQLYVGFRQHWQACPPPPATPPGSCRNQMVYAATNDGLLHAFWADETKEENNEVWAMVPPAVLPNLYSSYPSSHLFLLDGSPITKDIVWERRDTTTDFNVWHTMLVAGFGSSFPGYYAVDVTNPNPSNLNGVTPKDPDPTSKSPLGPTFLWQLTKLPSSVYQPFGKYSATPALTTLFVDPDNSGTPREIGVAILPGGKDGAPSATASCARASTTSARAPLGAWSARTAVRCWGTNHVSTDPVNGRSLAIVRADTGEILRVFARKADVPSTDPIFNRVNDTPLDSPMTGTPIPFPVDVGSDATKVFMGDEDGTIWRFDLSSTNPANWVGEMFVDLYNQDVDQTSTPWNDGQPFQVRPVTSLDPRGNIVLNVATGTTDQYDTNGIDLVYSVSEQEASDGTLRASVNWYLAPKVMGMQGKGLLDPGERVSGPMTVFNGTLYFATYDAGANTSDVCHAGMGKIWGLDFVVPQSTTKPADYSMGGKIELQTNPPSSSPPQYILETQIDPSLAGAVIPGVSIKATPACASLTSGNDQYVPGASHTTPTNFTPGTFSLFAQAGTKGTGGSATQQINVALPPPTSPTVLDSWAAVLE